MHSGICREPTSFSESILQSVNHNPRHEVLALLLCIHWRTKRLNVTAYLGSVIVIECIASSLKSQAIHSSDRSGSQEVKF